MSYGPRREDDGDTCPCHESEAEFWSVFTHDEEGHAHILCDCVSRHDAAAVATHVHRQAEQVASLERHNTHQQAQIVQRTGEIGSLRADVAHIEDALQRAKTQGGALRAQLRTRLGFVTNATDELIIEHVHNLQMLHRDAVDRLGRVHAALAK